MKGTVLGRKEMEAEGIARSFALPGDAAGSEADRARGIPAAARVRSRDAGGEGTLLRRGGIPQAAPSMEDMKYDMCGAAVFLGAFEAIGRMKLPINVVGLIGRDNQHAVGNGSQSRDVVKSHLGIHRDHQQRRRRQRCFLRTCSRMHGGSIQPSWSTAATLTGACVIALGHTATGNLQHR